MNPSSGRSCVHIQWQGHAYADSPAPCELQVCWAPGVLGAVVQVQSLDRVLFAVYVDQARLVE